LRRKASQRRQNACQPLPLLALSEKELAQLETKKLAAPAQDASHNQIESEPAIESDAAEG